MHSAMRSRLEPFKKLVRMLCSHRDAVLAWTKLRLSNGRFGKDEQQDQAGEPPRLWVPQCRTLRGGHQPLLRPATVTARSVIALLGDEPMSLMIY